MRALQWVINGRPTARTAGPCARCYETNKRPSTRSLYYMPARPVQAHRFAVAPQAAAAVERGRRLGERPVVPDRLHDPGERLDRERGERLGQHREVSASRALTQPFA